jgi:SsrA-binding protein
MSGSSKASDSSQSKTIAVNRRARFEYTLEEDFEAGLVLTGTEVKSLRLGSGVNISDAYAGEKDGELWLLNAQINPYPHGNRQNHEPRRPRKLLLHKKQMKKYLGRIRLKGNTLIPLTLYFNSRGIAKIKIGLATGKKQHEKREAIKERDWQREQQRLMRK